jgi:hypothetical protein
MAYPRNEFDVWRYKRVVWRDGDGEEPATVCVARGGGEGGRRDEDCGE